MKKLLFLALILVSTGSHAYCNKVYCLPDPPVMPSLNTGYNSGNRYYQEQQEVQPQREMLRIEQERNELMEQANRIQMYPQLYQFGYRGR